MHGTRRTAEQHRVVRKRLALRYERARADKTILSEHSAVQNDRAHTDERTVADRAAVQDRAVSHGHVFPDVHRGAGVGMYDHAVLQIGAVADDDLRRLRTQDRMEINAAMPSDPNMADEVGVRRNERGRVYLCMILYLVWHLPCDSKRRRRTLIIVCETALVHEFPKADRMRRGH